MMCVKGCSEVGKDIDTVVVNWKWVFKVHVCVVNTLFIQTQNSVLKYAFFD